jgi:transcriptional regulator with PAS, ATPase and Fis domain
MSWHVYCGFPCRRLAAGSHRQRIELLGECILMITKESNTTTPIINEQGTMLTVSNAMIAVLSLARRVSDSTATVLIQGESGTGKELLARFIHQHSGRRSHRFVAMNCAALPEQLAESELFGYEKGAFTGATQTRMGRFELAHQGTLLLDEISEMPLSLQVKLLRVLQEKEVDPIGGQRTKAVDVRVIATTNRDLREMVLKSEFREDLYYRLRVIPITIPPLRDRKEDIPLLSEFFLRKFCSLDRTPVPQFKPESIEQLSAYDWPGNVRELENTVERALLISEGPVIGPEFLLLDRGMNQPDRVDNHNLVGMTVKEMEQKLIGQTLKHVNDNRTYAAKMLGISIRTLRNKLKEYLELEDSMGQSTKGR